MYIYFCVSVTVYIMSPLSVNAFCNQKAINEQCIQAIATLGFIAAAYDINNKEFVTNNTLCKCVMITMPPLVRQLVTLSYIIMKKNKLFFPQF